MIYLYTLVAVAAGMCCGLGFIHMLQLESYQVPGYFRWLRRAGVRSVWIPVMLGVIGSDYVSVWLGVATLLGSVAYAAYALRAKRKKPLRFTPRTVRLLAVLALVLAAVEIPLQLLGVTSICVALTPVLVPLAALLISPVENAINARYFNDARRMLRERPDLIKIGVTGSYGKTSTKFILAAMLSQQYSVLATPQSKNTPMGVTIVVRSQLKPTHQVFIAEMGARHVGDIAEMCALVGPTIGVLTDVGPQHLETFGTLENVASTKYELIKALPEGGAAVFGCTKNCMPLYDKTRAPKYLAGLAVEGSAPDVTAEDISTGPEGSAFTLITPQGRIQCTTRLLGRHNIQNILTAAAVCLHLGMPLERIRQGIARAEPVEHRLQLLPSAGGVTVIDDAFNSNPAGAQAALDVLAQFDGRRVIVTPGMVELGDKEEEYNAAFGRAAAAVAHIMILVGGSHARPIRQGLLDAGFDAAAIYEAEDVAAASALLKEIGRAGDVVLFENDLPDNY